MAELRVYISISAEDRIATFGLHASGALTHRADFPLSGGPGPLAHARLTSGRGLLVHSRDPVLHHWNLHLQFCTLPRCCTYHLRVR